MVPDNSAGSIDVFYTSNSKESATDVVINKIKELLLAKALKPGDLLPAEVSLANSMNVSRGSVREAMKVLSAFGIVEVRRGDGTYISSSIKPDCFNPLLFSLLSENNRIDDLVELREIFELGIVKLVILHANDYAVANIMNIVKQFEKVIDSGTLTDRIIQQHENEFHSALVEATGNPLVVHIYQFLLEFFRPTILQTSTTSKTSFGQNTLEIHYRIALALQTRDQAQAERAIVDSVKTWGEYASM